MLMVGERREMRRDVMEGRVCESDAAAKTEVPCAPQPPLTLGVSLSHPSLDLNIYTWDSRGLTYRIAG